MTFEYQPRRSGKSIAMRVWLDDAITRGEVINLMSIKPDGGTHVCKVQHINTARRNK